MIKPFIVTKENFSDEISNHNLNTFDITDYLQNPKENYSILFEDKTKVLWGYEESIYFIKPNGEVWFIDEDYNCSTFEELNNLIKDNTYDWYAISRAIAIIKGKIIINNGDMIDNLPLSPMSSQTQAISKAGYKLVTVSFSTISRLFFLPEGKNNLEMSVNVINSLAKDFTIIDYSEDILKRFSKEQKKIYKKLCNHEDYPEKEEELLKELKPEAGFTLTDSGYHRPAALVLKNNKRNEYGLLAMDEESYFGCILPKAVKTLEEAYKSLIPIEARGRFYKRQGEWFFVLANKKEQKSLSLAASKTEFIIHKMTLPREDETSNPHTITVCDYASVDDLNLSDFLQDHNISLNQNIIFGDGRIVAYVKDFSCEHPEHLKVEDLNDRWFKIIRNTAIRSISAEGQVD